MLRLLGTPAYQGPDGPIELPSELSTSLLAYLACRQGWTDRGELATVFWPEQTEAAARHSLSQLLYRSRRRPWFSAVEAEPQRIRYAGSSDLAAFRDALARSDWQAATDAFSGNLLEGVAARDQGGFGAWLELEREDLLAAWTGAASSHAADLSSAGKTDAAAQLLRRVFQQDSLDEGILQQYLTVAALSSQRQSALLAYGDFREKLLSELGMEPLPDTVRLAARLHESAESSSPLQATAPTLRGAPAQLGGFIGRDLELAQLSSQLQDQATRLLTITGPGGMGKTRLALQVGQLLAAGYDQAGFVPLAPLNSAGEVPTALAAALGVDCAGPESWSAIEAALQGRRTLLVIDNLEHLPAASPVLGRLLEQAPDLQVIATSRAPLALRGEVLFELEGLSLPAGPDDAQFSDFGAVQLFMHNARRLVPEPDAGAANREAIFRIVQLLGGMPLGIELAVPWLRLLQPTELAAELEASLDLLQAQEGSDLPARHRSLSAAFEHSWRLLSERQRACLSGLAVFRGRFDRNAARQVAGAHLADLLALLDKSLLKRAPGGLFELHQPARQYALGKAVDPDEARAAHAGYLAQVAEQAELEMHGSGQQQWLDHLDANRADFLAAIDWAISKGDATLGLRVACSLQPLWWIRGPYAEGEGLLRRLTSLPAAADSELLARGQHRLGTLLQELPEQSGLSELYEQALAGARAAADRVLEADVLHSQAYRADRHGKLQQAEELYRMALDAYRQAGFVSGESASLNSLAVVLAKLEHLSEALPLLEESLLQKSRLGQLQGVAYALHNLGLVHHQLGDAAAGDARLQESIELKRRLGDTRGALSSHQQLALAAFERGDARQAAHMISAGLADARQIGHLLSQLNFLVLAVCFGSDRFPETAARLSGGIDALAQQHGGAEPLHGQLYAEALSQLDALLGSAALSAARLQGSQHDAELLHTMALAALQEQLSSH